MTTISSTAAPISAMEKLKRTATLPGASQATSAMASVQPALPSAAAQASEGAAQAQPGAPVPEPFNAPSLALPRNPTTREVLNGLTSAMADPTVNESSAQKLYQLHEQLLNAERGMLQAIIDGMLM